MKHILACAASALFNLVSFSIAQQSPGRPCPIPCSIAGNNPSNWSDLHGVPALKRCDETVLFDTAIFTPINDPDSPLTLRTCTTSNEVITQEVEFNPAPFTFGSPIQRRANGTNSNISLHGCVSNAETFTNKSAVSLLEWNADEDSVKGDGKEAMLSAANALKDYLSNEDECQSTIMMARHGEAVVGLYVGTEVVKSTTGSIMEQFISAIQGADPISRFAAEVCQEKAPSTWTIGIYADFRGNISATQESVKTWTEGKCLSGSNSKTTGQETEISFVRAIGVPVKSRLNSRSEQTNTLIDLNAKRGLVPRAECKAIQVADGDGCWSLSQRCGISQKDFESFNPVDDLCDPVKGVRPKQWVCCSKGDLPDMGPKPNPDGSCATYTIQKDDVCFDIAESFGITVDKIDEYNSNTWGWGGCKAIQPDDVICVSKGDPPMPSYLSNAICGPRVPGTQRPTNDTDIKDLNPCPLNVCCNVWGQCGIDNDFCVYNPADTGAPGTTKPGKNSCVSSCGMNITNNDKPPTEFRKIAYFEAWNHKRPCLHMDVTDIDTKKFTHVHFAFPNITPDFNVDVSNVKEQFDKLKSLKDIKRIVSFGGWAFSTEAPTYNIFREGVTDANRATLATNIAKFITDNELDGVDFDWEYPAAPDIPGIPPGAIDAGKQYLDFLKIVKRRLSNKSVGIAAPASYWYLKGFPIAGISEVVDYIVYMTYDLHGQWDYGNKWSSSGCEEGNCLRSHINITETTTSLAMVTKAGVPSHKVVVGVASYGRSFHMEDAGCDGPNCRFTGSRNESDAMPGQCTETGGYISNAEIREILANSKDSHIGYEVKSWHDGASNSDMLVYNNFEWVAYMSDTTKQTRTDWVKGLNFGGTSDWAVDLDHDYGDSGIGNTDPDSVEPGGGPVCDSANNYDTLEKIADDNDLDPTCAMQYSLRVLNIMLQQSIVKYRAVDDGYDSKFQSYVKYLKKGLPETLRQHMSWLSGEGQKFFDCHFVGNGKDWKGQCPVPRDVRGGLLIGIWTIDMTLRDKEGFYKDLYDKTGIMEEWIKFDKYEEETMCNPSPCNKLELTVNGMPFLKDDYEVPNPKDIVSEALGNTNNLQVNLGARMIDVSMGLWLGNNADVVQALSIPVFLVENAIDGMEDAKELGEEADKEEAKNKLLLILSLVFLIVPFLGEAAAVAAGAATMARVIALIGAGANAGLALQEVIENPDMAPFAIMELLTAGRLKTPKQFTDAVKFRNVMKEADIKTLGEKFVKQDALVQTIVKRCSRK
ncbi:glycoside hydrolase [Lojkania enalia]|uniref:chitinase n=1 Tax=Lojkania enalia TaxID=147567 RepID=A0A9P4N465_9PLEO|nr:glycoside hydrolase [Didymosphaeria enalia]